MPSAPLAPALRFLALVLALLPCTPQFTQAAPEAGYKPAIPVRQVPRGSISVGFSPDGSAERLVLGAIAGARHSIRVAAYGFTASAVAKALIAAHRRGVAVQVLVDWRANFEEDRRYARHAIGALQLAGVAVRAIDAYPIFHDKFMVIDDRTVQTGSYNYTVAAARYNAENVLVVWNDPALAKAYVRDWDANWRLGRQLPQSF